MQLFIFKRLTQRLGPNSNDYIKFAIPAETQDQASTLFQKYLDDHGEMIGSKEPWRNYWFLDIAGKVGDCVFSLT